MIQEGNNEEAALIKDSVKRDTMCSPFFTCIKIPGDLIKFETCGKGQYYKSVSDMSSLKVLLFLLCATSVCAANEVLLDEVRDDLEYVDDDLVHIVQVLKIKNLLSIENDCQAICGTGEFMRMCKQCKSRQPYRFG
ncbi:Hypothetical predicted protein [Cloeon dipterum]|uniref:Uncharacterized protein n=1 Tax=Cloeon dipterum TaxID=197152 RepID=A0A8S1C084_9INSE|nr:Hypothetical predicted protein [Cloeon dipterum]